MQQTLLAIDEVSLPLRKNICLHLNHADGSPRAGIDSECAQEQCPRQSRHPLLRHGAL